MFRFLHAADLHLDSPMRGLERYENAPVEAIRDATRGALKKLVSLAVAERVGFVLMAGDLYDGDWKDHNTGLFLAKQMADLRDVDIPVFIVQDNHDAASKLTKLLRLPDTVHHFAVDRPERHELPHLGVVIHGQGFASSELRDNLCDAYPARAPGAFNIGLLHTSATGREGHESYAPCSLDNLRAKGYDYWALGHIHKREVLHEGPLIVFPGNVQGRHVRETGPKGCMLVTVDDSGNATADFRSLDVARWEICRVDATGAIDGEDLLERFAAQLGAVLSACGDRVTSVRVVFSGRCAAHDRVVVHEDRWKNEVRAQATDLSAGRAWVEKVAFETRPLANPIETYTDGPIGELVQLVAELREEPGRLSEFASAELADLCKKLPVDVLESPDTCRIADPEWLRDLLDQVPALLIERLM